MWTFVNFLYILILLTNELDTGILAVQVYESVELYEYNDFSSTWPFLYTVPEAVSQATWLFQAGNLEPDHCEDKNITVYIQHGSLPVVNPDGEKFPKNFFLKHKSSKQSWVLSNNRTYSTTISSPDSGNWYVVVSLRKYNNHIRPKDLFVKCKYNFRSVFTIPHPPDIETLSLDEINSVKTADMDTHVYRFYIDLPTHLYTITISNCTTAGSNNTTCPVSMVTQGSVIPSTPAGNQRSRSQDCMEEGARECRLTLESPEVATWNYVAFNSLVDSPLEFSVSIETEECLMEKKASSNEIQFGTQSGCVMIPPLDRLSFNSMYKTNFVYYDNNTIRRVKNTITGNQIKLVPFHIKPEQDIGGSLVIIVDLQQITAREEGDTVVQVNLCIQSLTIPQYNNSSPCTDGSHLIVSDPPNPVVPGVKKVIIPYPQPGPWFVAMKTECFTDMGTNESKLVSTDCGNVTATVVVSIATDKCVEGGCSNHGDCHNYLNGHVLFSTCKCNTGWRGFACSDGSDSRTDQNQLLELLLLTISNAIFLPGIILALYRRHYVEALVYTYTMVFSALYHCCDGNRTIDYKICVLHPSILSVCDFLGSSTSIWVTLVAMVKPPCSVKSVLQMAGPLAFIVGVLYRKTSAWLFIAPAALGILLIIGSWISRCCVRHQCYPSKKRYFLCLLPGILLAAGGLFLFTFIEEEDNYLYTHSAWHAAMSLCILFLLPPRHVKAKYSVPSLGPTYQPITRLEENRVV